MTSTAVFLKKRHTFRFKKGISPISKGCGSKKLSHEARLPDAHHLLLPLHIMKWKYRVVPSLKEMTLKNLNDTNVICIAYTVNLFDFV